MVRAPWKRIFRAALIANNSTGRNGKKESNSESREDDESWIEPSDEGLDDTRTVDYGVTTFEILRLNHKLRLITLAR